MEKDIDAPAVLKELDDDGNTIRVWPLAAGNTFRIGRAPNNDITLPYSWISRKHTMIQLEANGIYNIIDLGSSNGTFINGRRLISSLPLNSGDHIAIGKTVMLFQQNLDTIPMMIEHDATMDRTVAYLQKEMVTILVCDLHGFTRISEKLGPHEVSKLLQHWSKRSSRIVSANYGSVDKFIGDAVMATWVGGDSAENVRYALKSALEIEKLSNRLGGKVPGLSRPMSIGAALNTGEAVMGNLGVDGHRDFTVVGDVVNVAFRLEELTSSEGFDIMLGPDTGRLIPDAREWFTRKKYEIKGKAEPITAYGTSFWKLERMLAA